MELVGAFTDAVDTHMRRDGGRTDLGEMAQMAAAETLTAVLGQRTRSLFGTSPGDIRRELAALATTEQFGTLARGFFAELTRRYLTFFLSRELSNHVGGNRRFANVSGATAHKPPSACASRWWRLSLRSAGKPSELDACSMRSLNFITLLWRGHDQG